MSRLFTAVADAERVHATNHFKTMANVGGAFLVPSMAGFGLGSTLSNLDVAIEGETFEINEMYPAYVAVAKEQNEADAVESFRRALVAEKNTCKVVSKCKRGGK